MEKKITTFFLLYIISYNCFSQADDKLIVTQNSPQKTATHHQDTTSLDSNTVPQYPLMNKIEVNKLPDTLQEVVKTSKTKKEYKPILLAIKVVDKTTNIPIKAVVQTISHPHTTGQGICNHDGKFHFNINNHSDIEIRISEPGYHTYIDTIDIIKEGFKDNIYTKVYQLTPFKKGDIVALDNIYFKQGDDRLLPDSHPALNKLADMMNTNSNMVILLGGHTENKGSKNQLIELSKKRVNAVRFYLLQKGIKLSRIKTIGYGASKPIYHGSDTDKQKINRRVDFKIIKF